MCLIESAKEAEVVADGDRGLDATLVLPQEMGGGLRRADCSATACIWQSEPLHLWRARRQGNLPSKEETSFRGLWCQWSGVLGGAHAKSSTCCPLAHHPRIVSPLVSGEEHCLDVPPSTTVAWSKTCVRLNETTTHSVRAPCGALWDEEALNVEKGKEDLVCFWQPFHSGL